MRALSIRQPYAELILRGIKTAELRSMSTTIVGERFYIYACKAKAKQPIWSDDLRVGTPPAWWGNGVQRSEVRDQKSGGGNQNASSLTSDFRPLTSST